MWAQLLDSLKNVVTFLGHVISFPIKIVQLLYGFDTAAIVSNGMWWLPVAASGCIVAILALSVIFRIFGK